MPHPLTEIAPGIWQLGPATLDMGRWQVSRAGVVIPITPSEHSLLETLIAAAGRVVSNAAILAHAEERGVADFAHDYARSPVQMQVHRLRKKLGPGILLNAHSAGWRLNS